MPLGRLLNLRGKWASWLRTNSPGACWGRSGRPTSLSPRSFQAQSTDDSKDNGVVMLTSLRKHGFT